MTTVLPNGLTPQKRCGAARVMTKRYGADAATEAAMRADEFGDQGNLDGVRIWPRIMKATEEL